MIREHRLTLSDGRVVSYSDSGNPGDRPVLLCHGLPGARLQIPSTAILAHQRVRVVVIERPGLGLSDPQPLRTLADWCNDACAVLDALSLPVVTLVGYSAGTAYALTLAAAHPDRVDRIHIVSGMAPTAAAEIADMSPFNRWIHSLGNTMPPPLRRAVAGVSARVIGTGDKAAAFGIGLMKNAFTPAEREYLGRPEAAVFRQTVAENFRQGYDGYLVDLGIVTREWPISYTQIHHPVSAWYGSADRITPPSAAKDLRAVLPQTTVSITPDAGHLMIFMAWDELITRIANEATMQTGPLIAEGKTKQVYAHPSDPTLAIIQHKDAITAGDGARRHVIPGKAALSGPTTANVFALLNRNGIATHYVDAPTADTMIVRRCTMIPIEIVTRRRATGSYLKRHSDTVEGQVFDPLVVEFFYKDDANHDPLMTPAELETAGITTAHTCAQLAAIAQRVFVVIETAFAAQDIALIDLKIECGQTSDGRVVVADVIDNDSWRIWPGGDKARMLDKQVYRNMQTVTDDGLAQIAALYRTAKELTDAWK